jgi:hypothetical protein
VVETTEGGGLKACHAEVGNNHTESSK